SYPPPGAAEAYGAGPQGGAYAAPPPPGYPVKDGEQIHTQAFSTAASTQSRGDGFWKGCCAALCCCCLLESCF
ncbi:hypothetical protein M569_16883, partial [Genlisea aurea]